LATLARFADAVADELTEASAAVTLPLSAIVEQESPFAGSVSD
jgi:hypothetical protein